MSRRRGEGSIRKVHCQCAACTEGCKPSCSHRNRWKAVWYCDGCQRHQVRGKHSKQFASETSAKSHLRKQLMAKERGAEVYVNHNRTFKELVDVWLAIKAKNRKRKTVEGYESIIDNWLLPEFGDVPVRKLNTARIDKFISTVDRQPNTVRNVYRVLFSIMAYGVKVSWLSSNPCAVELPHDEERKVGIVVTPDELEQLAQGAPSPYGEFIRLAGWTGLRSGELRALRVHDLNPLKGEIHVKRSVGQVSGGEWVEGPTKTYRERKLRVVDSALDPVIALTNGKGPDQLVFTNGHERINGEHYLSANQVMGALRKAAREVLPEHKHKIKVHDLRDTHASILIAYLAWDPVSVARRLGHRDANVTMSRYAHWFPERNDELMAEMENLALQSA